MLSVDVVRRVVTLLSRQACEKIDRVRERAGKALERILEGKVNLGLAPWSDELMRATVLPVGSISWNNSAEVYPKLVKLILIDELRNDVLVGLVVSIGGMTESLVKYSTAAFLSLIRSLPIDGVTSPSRLTLNAFLDSFLLLYQLPSTETKERIMAPLIEVTDVLIGGGIVTKACTECGWQGLDGLFDAVKKAVFKSKDVKKLTAAIKVFSGIGTIPGDSAKAARRRAVSQLVLYLVHPFPRVRKFSSEELYISLTSTSDDGDGIEGQDEVEEILLTTDWDKPAATLKPLRERIGELLKSSST
ncbi:hypothetical protein HDU76_003808 [Blyttiomyces sp. JEL0837]|nr:hypothetical protein HDU76_003808 [Blyttiomyces sp. JEL0837]